MTSEIVVPRLGWNMEQGVFMGWLKRDGDIVRVGEPLYTLEGDKAVQEIEAVESGVLRIAANAPKDGDTIPVGTLLGYLETGADAEPTQRSSPRARRAARERGIDIHQVRGTGRTGRIRERDVLAQTSPTSTKQEPRPSSLRRTIAERMVHSLRSTAPVTLTTIADATNLVNLREQFKQGSPEAAPSFTDLLVKLSALALKKHPLLNAHWQDDHVVPVAEINIGIAVDTDSGLLVPVVRNVPGLTLRQLALQTRTLADKARQGTLASHDMQGGTFTVTNLGSLGIDAFTPIINWPECAILGIGRIRRQPAVVKDEIVPRDQVTLSLTFDHRLVDGAPAARFLQALCGGVENPAAWLIE